MGAIAVQGAVGEIGEKAVTKLTNYNFNSMVLIGGRAIAANALGLHILNVGDRDGDEAFTRTVTFASTDFGISNPKHLRAIEFGMFTEDVFRVFVLTKSGEWREYESPEPQEGQTRIMVPIGSSVEGRYWTVRIESDSFFRLDNVKVRMIVTSSGKIGN